MLERSRVGTLHTYGWCVETKLTVVSQINSADLCFDLADRGLQNNRLASGVKGTMAGKPVGTYSSYL